MVMFNSYVSLPEGKLYIDILHPISRDIHRITNPEQISLGGSVPGENARGCHLKHDQEGQESVSTKCYHQMSWNVMECRRIQ